MTRRKQHRDPITNVRVRFEGKDYRICKYNGRVIMIGLKCSRGGERMLKHMGRRWKQVLMHERSLYIIQDSDRAICA